MNIDVNALSQIIRQVDGNHDLGAGALAEAILDRLPAPQVIRTVEKLRELDPETLLVLTDLEQMVVTVSHLRILLQISDIHLNRLPAVVLAPAEQVLAAREALEEA